MTLSHDVIFDGQVGSRFVQEIYGTTKGNVRLHILWNDLLSEIPTLKEGKLRVIDVGAGHGQISQRIAEFGNEVTLCEPSADMLSAARQSFRAAGLEASAHFVQAAAQDLSNRFTKPFDLVLCHAVLEWLADPQAILQGLLPLLKPVGDLSLMFFNQHAEQWQRILSGAIPDALVVAQGERIDRPGAIPLLPETVRTWLEEAGVMVRSQAGVRIFHDLVPEHCRDMSALEPLLELEMSLCKREPFASLGRHVHFIGQRM